MEREDGSNLKVEEEEEMNAEGVLLWVLQVVTVLTGVRDTAFYHGLCSALFQRRGCLAPQMLTGCP